MSRQLWQAVTHTPGADWDPDDAGLVKLLGYTAQAVAPAPETLSEPESTGFVASCCVHIESYIDDSMRLNTDGALLPDDPHLTWLRGEYLTAPDHWRTIFDRCRVLLRLPKSNLTARVYLASVLGSLGTPPGEPIFDATPGTPHADYVEAVIRSAWSQPCDERHARACHERRERDPECQRDGGFAVDALVRMGRTGEVPAAQLDQWLEQRVNRIEAPRRWRNLCWMSRDARLRQTLREKLATVGFVREAADDVKAILDARRLSDLEEEQRAATGGGGAVRQEPSVESPTPRRESAAAPTPSEEPMAGGAGNATVLVVASCEVANRVLDRSMADLPAGTLLPDDAHETWARTDRLFTQSPLSKASGLMLAVLEVPVENFPSRSLVATTMASFGAPPGEDDFALSSAAPQRDFVEAIVRSTWQQPCEERHAVACHKALERDPKCESEGLYAVDSLVRMGRTGEVPDEQLQVWLRERLNRAEASRRRRDLCWMTRYEPVRQMLREMLEQNDLVREAAEDVRATLASRSAP